MADEEEPNSATFNTVMGLIAVGAWVGVIMAIPLFILPALILGAGALLLFGVLKGVDAVGGWADRTFPPRDDDA